MSVYKVDICGVTTSKLPVLKDDEKEELFEKIKKGDKAAREKYIRGNLRLVLSVIRRFSNHNENMDDLFQIGCIGLMKSIDNFDPTIGVKFSTYAVPMIIGEVISICVLGSLLKGILSKYRNVIFKQDEA
jgi:RNA polymerase sporulation-specific sigma factor